MLVKPEQIFDRDAEWSALVGFATNSSPDVRLGVVSGRRRQGKTLLLASLADATGGFFYAASETTERDALRQLGVALAEFSGAPAPYHFATWDDALTALFTAVPDQLIIIDEFPYLAKASPSLPSLLQRALDPRGVGRGQKRTRIILCGSAMSAMGGLLGGTAPLRGRASLELLVRPLAYREAARFWGLDDPRLAVLVHAVVGGTPAYRREFTGGDAPESMADFDAWVVRTVLNAQTPLFREARYLLAEEAEIRDTALYHAVLGAIAAGNATRGGIASYLGRKSTDLAHPLMVLEDSHLVMREEDPFRHGRGHYRIAEPLITFYEAVMRPSWSQLERRQPERAWSYARQRFLAQVVGPHFEHLCREFAYDAGEAALGGVPGAVAAGTVADPARRSQIQLDVVVFAPDGPDEPRKLLSIGKPGLGKCCLIEADACRLATVGGMTLGEQAEPLGVRPEHHHADVSGGWLRAAVFGGMDGLVTNIALIAGVGGGGMAPSAILLAGSAGLVAGAISMAIGEYTSVQTQNEQIAREVAKERAELARHPDAEAEELAQRWLDRGLPPEAVRPMVQALREHPEEALRVHVQEELGVSATERASPWLAAVSSFACFAVGAVIPLLPYLAGATDLWPALGLGGLGLIAVGALAARFTGRPWWLGASRQLLLGAAAAGATYVIGSAIGVSVT